MTPDSLHESTGAAQPDLRSEVLLRRLRLVGVLLPVSFLVVLELFHPSLIERLPPGRGQLVLTATAVAAAVGFGLTMFFFIDRAHRAVVRQNQGLAALTTISAAVRGDLDVDETIEAATVGVLGLSGVEGVKVSVSAPGDGLPQADPQWRHGAGAEACGRTSSRVVDIPLRSSDGPLGTMSVLLRAGSGDPGWLSAEVLHGIGHQVGSEVDKARLVADLQRRQREGRAVHQLLLQISGQGDLALTLRTIAGFACDLLHADGAGLCVGDAASGAPLDGADPTLELACIVTDEARSRAGGACPLHSPAQHTSLCVVPIRGPEGQVGRLWVGRHDGGPFGERDRGFLETLCELTVVAVDHARMMDRERQGAVLAERERIARELHDSLAQVLGTIQLRLLALEARAELASLAPVLVELEDLVGVCQDAYQDVREAILGLHESSRTDRALLDGLRAYVDKFARQSGIETSLECDLAAELMLAPDAEVQVIRVIQEALTNVRKHARARSAVVRISEVAERTTFVVEDDGQGFDHDSVAVGREGFGLHSMRERIALVNGSLQVASAPGRGTRVVVEVPRAARPTLVPPIARTGS